VSDLDSATKDFLSTFDVLATKTAYSASLDRFVAAGGFKSLRDVVSLLPQGFNEIAKQMEASYKPGTLQLTVLVVRQFYRHLKSKDPSVVDPTTEYKLKRFDNVPDWNVLHSGDPAKLLALVDEPRDKAVLTALVLQGWRVSELCRLKWGDLREGKDGAVIAQFKAKRNKTRTQGVQEEVLRLAKEWAGRRTSPSDPFICRDEKGNRALTRFVVYQVITKHSKKLGKRVTPHGLRATYISSVINRKGIEAARQLAGHQHIGTTQRYSRWKIESDDQLKVEDL